MNMKRSPGLFAVAGLAMALTGPAWAQQQQLSPEQRYYNYQQSILAYSLCNNVQITQDQYSRLNRRVVELVGTIPSAARSLNLIEQAQGETHRDVAYRGGCANPEVVAALNLFQRDLAPALGG